MIISKPLDMSTQRVALHCWAGCVGNGRSKAGSLFHVPAHLSLQSRSRLPSGAPPLGPLHLSAAFSPAAAPPALTAPRATGPPPALPAAASIEALDYTKLVACVKELQSAWVPAKVQQVVMADRETLALKLRAPHDTRWLHLSWHPMAARVCLGDEPDRGQASEAFAFAQQASSRLLGQVLLGATVPVAFERVAQLDFGFRVGETPTQRLMCEVQGRLSNVVLTDGAGCIVMAAHQVGGKQSSLRQVQVGSTYAFPPQQRGLTPSADEGQAAWQSNVTRAAALDAAAAGGTLLGGLTRAYTGVSASLARELAARAEADGALPPAALSEAQWGALWAAWGDWLGRLESGAFAATRDPATNRCSVLGAYSEQFASANDLIDASHRGAQGGERFAALRGQLQKALSAAEKRLLGKLDAFRRQMSTAEAAAATQKAADLIMANVYQWPAGAASLEVDDWDTGERVTLALADAAAGPVACAKKLYAKAAKQRRAGEQLAPLRAEAQATLTYVAEVAASVASLDRYEGFEDLKALQEVRDELVEAGLMKAPADAAFIEKGRAKGAKAAKKRGAAPGGDDSKFRVYTAPSGLQVLIGRNNVQNDEISCRIAKPDDVWMHARGIPGSHLIVRVPAGREATQDDLQFAANLSTYFSKARESGKCDVIVCAGRDVKKPRGAKPGQVMVLKERVMVGFPEKSAAAFERA